MCIPFAHAAKPSSYVKHYTSPVFNWPDIGTLCQDSCGFIWIGSNMGITRFDGRHFRTFPIPSSDGAFNCQPRYMSVGPNNKMYIVTTTGRFVFDITTEEFSALSDSITMPPPTEIMVPQSELDEIDWGFKTHAVNTTLRDREGGIWLGTFYDGLFYYSDRQQLFSQVDAESAQNPIMRTICPTDAGITYAGSEDMGLYRLDTENNRLLPVGGLTWQGQPIPRDIHSLIATGDTLWIGTYSGGIYLMDIGENRIIDAMRSDAEWRLPCHHVANMFRTDEGNILIGTCYGLYSYSPQQRKCGIVEGSEEYFVLSMAQNADGTIWVGSTNRGLAVLRKDASDGGWTITKHPGFAYPCVTAMMEENDTCLLLGTDSEGLWRITPSAHTNIVSGTELGSSVSRILEDEGGRLWITTLNGLFCYDSDGEQLAYFTTNEGLDSNHFNFDSGLITKDGVALVGTYDGLTRFRPADFVVIDTPLTPHFTNINIGGKDTLATTTLTLEHDAPSFHIDFSVPTYAYPNTIYYRYKLENTENDWQMVTDPMQRIYFSHLADGHYRLLLQASYRIDEWLGGTVEMDIVVLPPFWRSTWAYMIYVLVATFIAITSFLLWRQRTDRKELKEQIAKLLQNQEYLRTSTASSPYSMAKEVMSKRIESDLLERVDAYLEANICNRDLSIETLADHMNMSASTLYRKLKAASSLSPNDYIRLYRLNTAARLLKQNGFNIKTVTEQTGFSSVAYFTNCFTKHFGITPGKYKDTTKKT